jgi:hypothetical protein
MNKRIKELALQAGGSHYPDVNPAQLEKFAELIIKDCVGIIDNQGKFLRYNELSTKIYEHFGIKK